MHLRKKLELTPRKLHQTQSGPRARLGRGTRSELPNDPVVRYEENILAVRVSRRCKLRQLQQNALPACFKDVATRHNLQKGVRSRPLAMRR